MSKKISSSRKQEVPLQDDNSNIFLRVMVCISVFLFGVTLAGVLSVNSMLNAWNESILGALTVQIMPLVEGEQSNDQEEVLSQQNKAIKFLKQWPGVAKAEPLSDKQLNRLIQPWLGDGIEVSDLPIPRLIDVKIKKDVPFNFAKLAEELSKAVPLASIDNHKIWLDKLIKFADSLRLLALVVLVLVICVTSGAIFYCTQTSLGLHQSVIEILHLMGAKDAYIAQQYARKTGFLGFVGGLYGLVVTIPTIIIIARLATQIEGGIICEASLSLLDWAIIFSLPIFSSLIAMITAYYTVKHALKRYI